MRSSNDKELSTTSSKQTTNKSSDETNSRIRRPNKKIFNEDTWTQPEQPKGKPATKSFYEGNRNPSSVSDNNDVDDKIEPSCLNPLWNTMMK